MFCSSCGREISDKVQFCCFCGAAASDATDSDAGASGRDGENCPARTETSISGREKTSVWQRFIAVPQVGYEAGFLFPYITAAIIGLLVNTLVIWIDYLVVVGILDRHDHYFAGLDFLISRDPYVFLYLIGFAALGGGIFLLREKNGDKAHSMGKVILGIVLGIILAGECVILFRHRVMLGVFLVSLALSLLLGFCVHSVKLWVHMVYYAAAVFLNVGCTMFIYLECINGRVPYWYFADSVAVVAPFTILLPLISFERGRYCPAPSGRNAHSEAERSDSVYRSKQPTVQADRPGSPEDASSFGYAVLGFFVPAAGLVLWLVWRDTLPFRAKSAGKGALTAVILNIVGAVIYVLYVLAVVRRFTF